MSHDHLKLDKSVQRWIFKQGWSELREVQRESVDPILAGNTDVVVSASTAAGKTEAFFLPACSAVVTAREDNKKSTAGGVDILYISPLKALINDQHRRLESLSEVTGIQVTSWHGDSSQSGKNKQKKSPSGIILITPESLEALLFNNAGWVAKAFKSLKYIVIDEFHAFLGTERGQHLISLLTRLEYVTSRTELPIPRVALSATLGDIDSTPALLRPSQSLPCVIIKEAKKSPNMRLVIKGFTQPNDRNKENTDSSDASEIQMSNDLYKFCRGSNNLVFANSRAMTEGLAARLRDTCEANVVPNEFFPHHGSLSKDHSRLIP